MTETKFEQVGEKGHIVLTAISDGCADVREVREATTLSIGTVNYRLSKLDDLGLVEIGESEGREQGMVDGEVREYDSPKPVELTDLGQEYFEWTDRQQQLKQYRDLSREELVEVIHDYGDRIQRLETAVEMLREQFQREIE